VKPYVIKEANRYLIYTKEDFLIGSIYLQHGQGDRREELEKIINEAFEVRKS
jgi:hypothetical protein